MAEQTSTQTLFETELAKNKPSAFDGEGQMETMRPISRYNAVQKVKNHIENITSFSSYQGKEDTKSEEFKMLMEVWLHGLNQTVPPQFSELKD